MYICNMHIAFCIQKSFEKNTYKCQLKPFYLLAWGGGQGFADMSANNRFFFLLTSSLSATSNTRLIIFSLHSLILCFVNQNKLFLSLMLRPIFNINYVLIYVDLVLLFKYFVDRKTRRILSNPNV